MDSKQILKNNFSLFLCRDVFHQNTPDIIPSKVIRLTMNYKRNEINWYFLNEKKKTNQKCTTMCYISRESIERVRKIFNYNFYDENWFFPLRLQFVWVHLIKFQGNQRSDDFKNVTLYRMWNWRKKNFQIRYDCGRHITQIKGKNKFKLIQCQCEAITVWPNVSIRVRYRTKIQTMKNHMDWILFSYIMVLHMRLFTFTSKYIAI